MNTLTLEDYQLILVWLSRVQLQGQEAPRFMQVIARIEHMANSLGAPARPQPPISEPLPSSSEPPTNGTEAVTSRRKVREGV